MFERFTKQARDTVIQAQREARDLRHAWIGTEHVLLALLTRPDAPGVATLTRLGVTRDAVREALNAVVPPGGGLGDEDTQALRVFGIDLDEVRRRAEDAFGEGALDAPLDVPIEPARRFSLFGAASRRRRRRTERGPGHIRFAARSKKVLELSLRESIARKDGYIGIEHVVLGLLRSDDAVTSRLFERLRLEPRAVRGEVVADLRKAA